jgi:hypothetical protein
MIGELITRLKRPNSWVEMTDDGFSVMTKRLFLRPWKKTLAWLDVQQITAFLLDCGVHRLGLEFIPQSGRQIQVDDLDSGWREFLEEVLRRFPDFDQTAFKKVEALFPGEGALTCWKKGSANHTPDGICQPADGLLKPSV